MPDVRDGRDHVDSEPAAELGGARRFGAGAEPATGQDDRAPVPAGQRLDPFGEFSHGRGAAQSSVGVRVAGDHEVAGDGRHVRDRGEVGRLRARRPDRRPPGRTGTGGHLQPFLRRTAGALHRVLGGRAGRPHRSPPGERAEWLQGHGAVPVDRHRPCLGDEVGGDAADGQNLILPRGIVGRSEGGVHIDAAPSPDSVDPVEVAVVPPLDPPPVPQREVRVPGQADERVVPPTVHVVADVEKPGNGGERLPARQQALACDHLRGPAVQPVQILGSGPEPRCFPPELSLLRRGESGSDRRVGGVAGDLHRRSPRRGVAAGRDDSDGGGQRGFRGEPLRSGEPFAVRQRDE